MDPIEIMKRPAPYASGHEKAPAAAQLRAKRLCAILLQLQQDHMEALKRFL